MASEDKIYEELMIDFLSGTISEENQQQLSELIQTSKEFKVRFDEMLKLRAITHVPVIESSKQSNYAKLQDRINSTSSTQRSGSWFSSVRNIAASIVFIISLSLALFYGYRNLSSPSDTAYSYVTYSPEGSQTKIILPDSTIVWINSASTLKYNRAYGKKSRAVMLVGEGYFEVADLAKRPFIVTIGDLSVNVLGTVFNVRAYDEEENVTINLLKGSVKLTLPGSGSAQVHTMKPNDQLVFNKLTRKVELTQINASRSALWTTGRLSFVDATFEHISRDLERKYKVTIQITDNTIKNEVFSGSIDMNLSLKEVLNYIDVDKKFAIQQQGDTLLIKSKKQ